MKITQREIRAIINFLKSKLEKVERETLLFEEMLKKNKMEIFYLKETIKRIKEK